MAAMYCTNTWRSRVPSSKKAPGPSETFEQLVGAALEGTLTPAQRKAFAAMLAADPKRRADYVRQVRMDLALQECLAAAACVHAPAARRNGRRWIAAAAVLLLLCGVGFAAWVAARTLSSSGAPESGEPDVAAVAVRTAPVASAAVRTADSVELLAEQLSIVYVATNGDDTAFGSKTAPFLTISNAVTKLAPLGGGTVIVNPGVYTNTDTILITNAIAVVGNPHHPDDVVITKSGRGSIFRLDHASAWLSGLVLSGATFRNDGSSGALHIQASGGTASDCVIRNNYDDCYQGWNGGVAGVRMAAGRVTHCVITNNSIAHPATGGGDNAAGVYISGGQMDNCLIANNRVEAALGAYFACGGVGIAGGSLVNCTVVSNQTFALGRNDWFDVDSAGGLVLKSKNNGSMVPVGVVTNCVMAGNFAHPTNSSGVVLTVLSPVSIAAKGLGRLVACATDGAAPVNETCVTGTAATFFVDYAHGDYTPNDQAAKGSSLYDAGAASGWSAADTDLAGRSRVIGKRIDIGCYESARNSIGGFVVRIL